MNIIEVLSITSSLMTISDHIPPTEYSPPKTVIEKRVNHGAPVSELSMKYNFDGRASKLHNKP
jgi:hypothetical protein